MTTRLRTRREPEVGDPDSRRNRPARRPWRADVALGPTRFRRRAYVITRGTAAFFEPLSPAITGRDGVREGARQCRIPGRSSGHR